MEPPLRRMVWLDKSLPETRWEGSAEATGPAGRRCHTCELRILFTHALSTQWLKVPLLDGVGFVVYLVPITIVPPCISARGASFFLSSWNMILRFYLHSLNGNPLHLLVSKIWALCQDVTTEMVLLALSRARPIYQFADIADIGL